MEACDGAAGVYSARMIKLQRLGHVLISVRDLEKSKDFYTRLLGFKVLEQDPDHGGLFLAIGLLAHHLADPLLRHAISCRRLADIGSPGIFWRPRRRIVSGGSRVGAAVPVGGRPIVTRASSKEAQQSQTRGNI